MQQRDVSEYINAAKDSLTNFKRESMKYNFMLQQLRSNEHEKVTIWLQALTQCTTYIQPMHTDLLFTLYNLQLSPSQQFLELYYNLLLHMITANTAFVNGVIHSIFTRIIPENNQLFSFFLSVCQKIITLVPLSIQFFISNFQKCMPNKWKTVQQFTTYVEFFRTSFDMIPQIGEQCLISCIELMISYDTDIQKNSDMFEIDEMDSVTKLNELLTYILSWIGNIPQHLEKTLLKTFDNLIVKTQFISYTPIIYLFYCSNEERCNTFVSFLLSQIAQSNKNVNSAELYTCHLGGFVSNSAILPASMTNEILEKIGQIFSAEKNMTVKILLCQQVFTIINSKIVELETRTDITGLFGSNGVVAKMIVDKCNPFGNCSQRTVKQFINICKSRQLMDPQQLLAENALLVEPLFVSCPLVSYDPYHIPEFWKDQTNHLVIQKTPFELYDEDEEDNNNQIQAMSLENNSWDFTL